MLRLVRSGLHPPPRTKYLTCMVFLTSLLCKFLCQFRDFAPIEQRQFSCRDEFVRHLPQSPRHVSFVHFGGTAVSAQQTEFALRKTHNERHSKDGWLLHRPQWADARSTIFRIKRHWSSRCGIGRHSRFLQLGDHDRDATTLWLFRDVQLTVLGWLILETVRAAAVPYGMCHHTGFHVSVVNSSMLFILDRRKSRKLTFLNLQVSQILNRTRYS
jgi:hypothetical protein